MFNQLLNPKIYDPKFDPLILIKNPYTLPTYSPRTVKSILKNKIIDYLKEVTVRKDLKDALNTNVEPDENLFRSMIK